VSACRQSLPMHHPAKIVPDDNHIGPVAQSLMEDSNNRRVGEREALESDSWHILGAYRR